MRDVYDYAKYFIKNGADSTPNTYDGNMKLQKLLVLADLANIAEYGQVLFNDEVLAFKNGCVVEKIRLRYKNDCFEPDFTENEYEILGLVLAIFGSASARELSEINHTFNFWKQAYQRGTDANGFHNKFNSVVDMVNQTADVQKMKEILDAYKESAKEVTAKEIINGITYYYDGFELTDAIIEQLESFSLTADDDVYSMYMDDGKLVIY